VNTDIDASKSLTTATSNEPDLEGEIFPELLPPNPLGASSTSRQLPPRSTLLASDPYYKPPRREIHPFDSPPLPPTPSLQPPPDPIMSRPHSPAAPAIHSSGGVKFNPPAVFDGSFKDYKRFSRELLIFLTGHKIRDDATKIAVALSFMRGGYADEFAQETVNLASTDPEALDWGTWADFIARLDARFKDKNFMQTAREKLEHFQQGKLLVDTYMAQLESLFIDAGIKGGDPDSAIPAVIAMNAAIDAEKIRILEKSAANNILETIYTSDNPIPTTFDAYKDKILQLGRMRERYRQFRSITSPTSSSTTTHAPKPPAAQFHTHIHPPADKKTGTGITYGGAGQPMDLSVGKTRQQIRCFNCGEFGHMRRDCPKEKNVDIRALIVGLEEELAELRVEAENGDKDFQDGR